MEQKKDQQNMQNQTPDSKKELESKTPLKTRIWAWIGVVFMVALVLLYTYSIASGKIFAW